MSYSYLNERRTLSQFLHIQIKRLSLLGGRSVKEVIRSSEESEYIGCEEQDRFSINPCCHQR